MAHKCMSGLINGMLAEAGVQLAARLTAEQVRSIPNLR